MDPLSGQELLARACHALRCEQLRRQGWVYGDRYDEGAKTHNALLPFDEVHPLERRTARDAAERLAENVTRECSTDRAQGANREFIAVELEKGVRVAFGDPFTGEPYTPLQTGSIESWELEPDEPYIHTISVRWDDGEQNDYAPCECELFRLAELPGISNSRKGSW